MSPAKESDTQAIEQPIAGNIAARMVAVMRDLGAIGKDKKNEAQGFKYRGIDDVYNAINPILAKHGVFMTAQIISKSREERTNAKGTVLAFTSLRMRYSFIAEDGTSVETEAEGEGMDSGDKSSNKAMAVAHKYALLQAFCIPTKDLDDPDAQVHEVTAKPARPAAAHGVSPPEDDDQDTRNGVANWCAQQKELISECQVIIELTSWLDKNGGDWVSPTSQSALHRLKKAAPAAYNDLKTYYMAKLEKV